MAKIKDKHPNWFKLKVERRQLMRQLPPENAVNVLLACFDYLETGEMPATLSAFEKIAVSAFLPDLEEAWAKYEQRINAKKGKSYDIGRYRTVSTETEEETETEEKPLRVFPSKTGGNLENGDAAFEGGPPPRIYRDPATGEWKDREKEGVCV